MKNTASSTQTAVNRGCTMRSVSPAPCTLPTTRYSRGYTLLELIVSVGVFSIVMLAATGAYLSLIKLDKQSRSVSDVANNLSFAVDSMSRAIRTGTAYKCNNSIGSPNCVGASPPGTSFGFVDNESPTRAIVYQVVNNQVVATINGGTAIPLTDPRIRIDALEFRVRGVGTGDGIQPQVTFNIRGTMVTGPGKVTTFSIQSGVTRRRLEL